MAPFNNLTKPCDIESVRPSAVSWRRHDDLTTRQTWKNLSDYNGKPMHHEAVSLRLLLVSPGEVVKSLGSKQWVRGRMNWCCTVYTVHCNIAKSSTPHASTRQTDRPPIAIPMAKRQSEHDSFIHLSNWAGCGTLFDGMKSLLSNGVKVETCENKSRGRSGRVHTGVSRLASLLFPTFLDVSWASSRHYYSSKRMKAISGSVLVFRGWTR
jgi:hypothetical protein